MNGFLADPLIQTAVVPLVAGLVAVGVLRLLGGRAGARLAVAGIGATFLVAYLLIVGLPALPPPSSMGRLFWSAAAGLVVGIVGDLAAPSRRNAAVLVGVWLAASLLWITAPALVEAPIKLVVLAIVAGAAAIALTGTASLSPAPTAPALMLLAAALAVGGTALIGSSASIAQLAFALVAATGGFLLWNWPVPRHSWGVSGQVALGYVVLLGAALAFFTQARAEVLLAVLPAFFADRVSRRVPLPDTATGRAVSAVVLGGVAILPALAAVAIAFFLAGPQSVSGY